MASNIVIPADVSVEQLHMIIGALYLCLGRSFSHIAQAETADASGQFRQKLLASFESGSIDMGIFDDAKTFDFTLAMIDSLLASTIGPRPADQAL
jgi:hypothetical protein